jgi:hypothetical protein
MPSCVSVLSAERTSEEYDREMERLFRQACAIRQRPPCAGVEIYSAQHPLAQSYILETGHVANMTLQHKRASDCESPGIDDKQPHSPQSEVGQGDYPDPDELLAASLFSFTSPASAELSSRAH